MKLKTAAVIMALCACSARASLIDLTPGGFNPNDPPPVFTNWANNHFLHDAFGIAYENASGWDSHFLGEPLFSSTALGGSTVTLTWNLTGTPYSFGWVFLSGPNGVDNMYQVPLSDTIAGQDVTTINGAFAISQLGIYGPVPIPTPDGGSTAWLFLLPIGLYAAYEIAMRHMVNDAVRRAHKK